MVYGLGRRLMQASGGIQDHQRARWKIRAKFPSPAASLDLLGRLVSRQRRLELDPAAGAALWLAMMHRYWMGLARPGKFGPAL